MSPLIAPSLLSANFADLQSDIEMINRSKADWLHLDIMDGVFVPNISFGFPIIEAIAPLCKKPLDVHLMITQPEKFISRLQSLGTYMMNVHYEACLHLHRTVQEIKKAGMKAGITLNPHTPVAMLEDIITDADMILIMSVNPGFGGQKFIPQSIEKIARLKEMILPYPYRSRRGYQHRNCPPHDRCRRRYSGMRTQRILFGKPRSHHRTNESDVKTSP